MEGNKKDSSNFTYLIDLARDKLYHQNDIVEAYRVLRLSGIPLFDSLETCYRVLNNELDVVNNGLVKSHFPNPLRDISCHLNKMRDMVKDYIDYQERIESILSIVQSIVPKEYLEKVNSQVGEIVFSWEDYSLVKDIEKVKALGIYGWLDRDGNWFQCEYAKHDEWAKNYCIQNWLITSDNINNGRFSSGFGDFLVFHMGFCLVHSPSMGTPSYICKRLTKRQREFLYSYYIEHGYPDEANQLYNEDVIEKE